MLRKNQALENTAAIYARYSSDNQREESLDAQIRACRKYAEDKGLNIVEIYTDSAKTGTNDKREGFQKMIKDSSNGLFKNLIIHKLDRFSRDKYDSIMNKRKLKINNVKIISVMENLDGSPESIILESMLEGMAQYYSANLSRETMKGMTESAYKATHLGGIPPLGYDVDPETKRLILNEAEAKIVQKIFEKYANGCGYNQILDYLNGSGYLTKRGHKFGKNSLYSILHNDKYSGVFVFNKKLEKSPAGTRNPTIKPRNEWIIVEGGVPQIIDKETFEKVQQKLSHNQQMGGKFKAMRTKQKPIFVLPLLQ